MNQIFRKTNLMCCIVDISSDEFRYEYTHDEDIYSIFKLPIFLIKTTKDFKRSIKLFPNRKIWTFEDIKNESELEDPFNYLPIND